MPTSPQPSSDPSLRFVASAATALLALALATPVAGWQETDGAVGEGGSRVPETAEETSREASQEASQEERYREARQRLVRERIASSRAGMEAVRDERVLTAMLTVPRHRFVRPELRDVAYRDRPLPIGHGQTISQPSLVALMTELVQLEPGEKALEIGTGSGYQAAVLAEITDSVYTVEIIEPLAARADRRFREQGYDEIVREQGDGYFGWPEHAPFDAIVVTAAASHIPPPLIEQLAPGGRMIIPVGPPFRTQQLMLVEKREDGSIVKRGLMPVRFVPFRRADDSGGA